MKRILIFSLAYIPLVGGAEIAIKEITDRLGRDKDLEFYLITVRPNKTVKKFERVGNVNVFRVGFFANQPVDLKKETFLFKIDKILFIFLAFFKAVNLNRKNKYNICWSIMANYAGFSCLFFKLIFPKIKMVLTLQEGDSFEHIKKRVGIFWLLYKKIFAKADVVQCISNYLAVYAKEMGYRGLPIVIPNGVNIEIFSRDFDGEYIFSKRRRFLKDEEKMVFTSSRLVEKNGIEDLIRSMTFLDDNIKLLIAGTGPLDFYLKKLVSDINLKERVFFLGQITQNEISEFLKASDVFCRPSLSEGLGNSFLEAMVSGVPVIATNVGGIPDFLIDGETGLFCKIKDPKDIAEKIKNILDDTQLRKKLVENAKSIVISKYNWDFLTSKFLKGVFD